MECINQRILCFPLILVLPVHGVQLPLNSQTGDSQDIQRQHPGGEWSDMLDLISRRKTQALAPEHFENMWTKGRNYRKKEGENRLIEHAPQGSLVGTSDTVDHSKAMSKQKEKGGITKVNFPEGRTVSFGDYGRGTATDRDILTHSSVTTYQEEDDHNLMRLEEIDSGSSSSYTTEDEETSTATGLDSPAIKVWDGRNNRNLAVSHIHHPLESSEGHIARKTGKGHISYQRLSRNPPGRKRSRVSGHKVHVWQEVERTSFLSGDGQDILNSLKEHGKAEDSSDDSDMEMLGRVHSGAAASSSAPSISIANSHNLEVNSLQNSLLAQSFLKLRCEVLGANIVKSGSRTFAVYSISVTDANNNSWSIKRRFRHFEELHRRLKVFSEYNLHLPPKHFLSTGLDMPVIQERCKLLDKYLKKLLQLPTVSGSIEVWDFLSVDSQTYMFSNSISILETLSVDLDDKPPDNSTKVPKLVGPVTVPLSSKREHLSA
ncbi:hypothetical protein L1049_005238 [Liquidambar formosana]|uniref:PX domain-containing protein n=1 Tax=Liquidambar formosana TaxID=63359 RepID=A0AAP0WWG7_LIQFO